MSVSPRSLRRRSNYQTRFRPRSTDRSVRDLCGTNRACWRRLQFSPGTSTSHHILDSHEDIGLARFAEVHLCRRRCQIVLGGDSPKEERVCCTIGCSAGSSGPVDETAVVLARHDVAAVELRVIEAQLDRPGLQVVGHQPGRDPPKNSNAATWVSIHAAWSMANTGRMKHVPAHRQAHHEHDPEMRQTGRPVSVARSPIRFANESGFGGRSRRDKDVRPHQNTGPPRCGGIKGRRSHPESEQFSRTRGFHSVRGGAHESEPPTCQG